MLSFLPTPLLIVISTLLVILNAAIVGGLVTLAGLLKLLVPRVLYPRVTALANRLMWVWSENNRAIFHLINKTEFVIKDNSQLSKEQWYLLICNHQSWADIVLLCMLFGRRIPMPKFFLKQQLLYVPFIGQACWALDMPFMRRYSRNYLIKHPEKRGKDLESTKKSCEKFRHTPTTVINFVEGTRFNEEKRLAAKSKYQHLMPPKPLGIAYTLSVLGEQFSHLLNVTIAYPGKPENMTPFKALLSGKLTKAVVDIESIDIDENLRGDYLKDKQFKQQFKHWLDELWEQKDRKLEEFKVAK